MELKWIEKLCEKYIITIYARYDDGAYGRYEKPVFIGYGMFLRDKNLPSNSKPKYMYQAETVDELYKKSADAIKDLSNETE